MTTSRSEPVYDVVVVGAGPAGLAAATEAGVRGATVALVDAGSLPGGQYWRQPAGPVLDRAALSTLHHGLGEYHRLVGLLGAQRRSRRTAYFPLHHIWTVGHDDAPREEPGFVVRAVDRSGPEEHERTFAGRRLVLAPGAYDRQVPFPGWDLPGVLTAGGAQALLKGHGVVAGQRVVVAGTGPFLLPVAAGLAESGATVVGVHEAASPVAWLRHPQALARNASKLREGLGYAATLVRHSVPVRTRSVLVAAHGRGHLDAVTVARSDDHGGTVPGSEQTLRADTLAVGWGFTPQLELPLALGCGTRVDLDGSLVCVVDDEQRTDVPGVYVAGEACGVGGADLALVEGAIAGAAAAGTPLTDARPRRRRAALRSFASALHRAHPVPSGWTRRVEPDTVVCRCEEVTAGRLREAVLDLGGQDARSTKLLVRPGMGWCQGRVCGYATACLAATWSGTPYDPRTMATRPVAAPVTLGALAEGLEEEIR